MLVLSRRVGEEIVIGGDIRISVVAIRGQQVRLGITAPKWSKPARPILGLAASRSAERMVAATVDAGFMSPR